MLRPGVDAILARHRVAGEVARFADGSLPVYAIGEAHVLKLYPPVYAAEERETEASVLAAIADKLPISTPRVGAIGEHSGWSYILMDRLRGEGLATAWPRIGADDRERLLADLGEAFAALLEAVLLEVPTERVLLHTEVMREHLLDDSLDEAFARRLLACAIVHRYSNLRWYLERLPARRADAGRARASRLGRALKAAYSSGVSPFRSFRASCESPLGAASGTKRL